MKLSQCTDIGGEEISLHCTVAISHGQDWLIQLVA
jgi:hypothetical protein